MKKGYVILFILAMISLSIGFFLTGIIGFIPRVDSGDPGYEGYMDLIANLNTISTLFLNLGFGLFLLSMSVGAVTDKRFSIEVKRGMWIASGLVIVAWVMFNYLLIYFIIA